MVVVTAFFQNFLTSQSDGLQYWNFLAVSHPNINQFLLCFQSQTKLMWDSCSIYTKTITEVYLYISNEGDITTSLANLFMELLLFF